MNIDSESKWSCQFIKENTDRHVDTLQCAFIFISISNHYTLCCNLVLVLLKKKKHGHWFRKQMKLSIHQRKHRQTFQYPSACFYFHQHFKSLHTLLQLGVSSFKEKKHEHWFRKQMKLSIHQRKHIQTCRYPSVCFYSHQYFKSLHTLLQFCNFCLVDDFASIDTKHVYSMSILD